jgi:hypothetical protein
MPFVMSSEIISRLRCEDLAGPRLERLGHYRVQGVVMVKLCVKIIAGLAFVLAIGVSR